MNGCQVLGSMRWSPQVRAFALASRGTERVKWLWQLIALASYPSVASGSSSSAYSPTSSRARVDDVSSLGRRAMGEMETRLNFLQTRIGTGEEREKGRTDSSASFLSASRPCCPRAAEPAHGAACQPVSTSLLSLFPLFHFPAMHARTDRTNTSADLVYE